MKGIFSIILIGFILLGGTGTVACTSFTFFDGEKVLMGNNEDWLDPDAFIVIKPANGGRFGTITIELIYPPFTDSEYSAFSGFNDQGLCFDTFLHPPLKVVNSLNKPTYNGEDLIIHCLQTCSTVNEVIAEFDKYNLEFMEKIQYFVVDKYGDSVLIEGDDVINKEGNYQIVTNFLHSHPDLGGYPCWRYNTVVDMLENMEDFSVEYFTSICNRSSQGGITPTMYTYIYDFSNGDIYLSHYFDFDNKVKINIYEELEKGYNNAYYLHSLFLPEGNDLPDKPARPDGVTSGKVQDKYTYITHCTDPDEDDVLYLFDWGDGSFTGWIGPRKSGLRCSSKHSWNSEGTYSVRVKVKDIYGQESPWSDPLSVSISKKGELNFYFLHNFSFLFDFLKSYLNFKLVI